MFDSSNNKVLRREHACFLSLLWEAGRVCFGVKDRYIFLLLLVNHKLAGECILLL